MEDALRRYIDVLFEGATPTKKAVELKEEMIQNLEDKYRDLVAGGKTPEAAFNIAVAGVGDISTLLEELENDFMPDTEKLEARRRKSAMITAIAVMMYILSVLPLIIMQELGVRHSETIGIAILFVVAATATGLLIYNNMTKPKHYKKDDTMVEEFLEWQAESSEDGKLRGAISGALWTLIVALYFIISFTTFAWHITWIIFILGAGAEAIINLIFTLKKR